MPRVCLVAPATTVRLALLLASVYRPLTRGFDSIRSPKRGGHYLLGDAGSFFFDPAGDNDGFVSPEAAAEWARRQTIWPELDLSRVPGRPWN